MQTQWHKRARPLLGTFVEVGLSVSHDDSHEISKLFNHAFARIEQVQSLMSAYVSDSDTQRINAAPLFQVIEVHPLTTHVLRFAKQLHNTSDGYFDCVSAGSLRNLAMPAENQIHKTAVLQLDLGGIAKGFAVDCAIHTLRQHRVVAACVNAGGDLRVYGAYEHDIMLRLGHAPQHLHGAGRLRNGAFAASGVTLLNDDKKIMTRYRNPITGKYFQPQHTYGVIATQCMRADALTKILMLHPNAQSILALYGAHKIIL